jgi:RimJ/RimL family protein N-acetyltransferase
MTPPFTLTPVTLRGRHVVLEPMRAADVDPLFRAGTAADLWANTVSFIRSREDMARYVAGALKAAEERTALPFVLRRPDSGEVAGSTRFGNASPEHRRVEIGWTWVVPDLQRTPVNTEAKYLMLRHAFESLGVVRVEFKTDFLNAKSRAALQRIGAVEEGVLRRHMRTEQGRVRDTVYYSITDAEWPAVKPRLEALLARPWPPVH